MSELHHVACPHCAGLNRVPGSRLADRPSCGRCSEPLFIGRPVALDERNFRNQVERSDLPVLIDFWASWCGPCQQMAPAFEQAAATLEPRIRLAKVDTEAQPGLAARFGIRSIPTLVLLRRGQELARQAGAMGTADIVRWATSTAER